MDSLSTLCHIESNGKYLMLHRTKKEHDVNKDKWIGIGGHFEENESPEECMLREVREETGITLDDYRFRGIVTFVSGGGVTEYMHLFTAVCGLNTASPLPECREGVLTWVPVEELWKLNIWEGDKIFFRLMDEEVPFFSLKLVYDGGDTLVSASLNGRPLELFDVIDSEGKKTGVVRERGVAHRDGSRHATVHMWITKRREDGGFDVLLQKRSMNKDSHPGLLDISSAGHIEHGAEPLEAALRELKEELGITASPKDLKPFGTFPIHYEGVFHGFPFLDNELSYEYLYEEPVDISALTLQKEEVESVQWMDLTECIERTKNGSLAGCLYPEELEMLRDALTSGPSGSVPSAAARVSAPETGRPKDPSGRLSREIRTYDLLDRLGISYIRADHPHADTMEDCLAIDEALGAPMCKNLFLCNRQKTQFFLLMMPGEKPFKTKDLSAQINSARLSFAPAEKMLEYLDIEPGAVSVLGLMNDTGNAVRLLIDEDVLASPVIGCHPCVNTSSLALRTEDLLRLFLPAVHHSPEIVRL